MFIGLRLVVRDLTRLLEGNYALPWLGDLCPTSTSGPTAGLLSPPGLPPPRSAGSRPPGTCHGPRAPGRLFIWGNETGSISHHVENLLLWSCVLSMSVFVTCFCATGL